MAAILVKFGMVELLGFRMVFKYQTIQHLSYFLLLPNAFGVRAFVIQAPTVVPSKERATKEDNIFLEDFQVIVSKYNSSSR